MSSNWSLLLKFSDVLYDICLYATCPTVFILHLITLTSDTVVSIVTMLKAGLSGIPFLAGTRDPSSPECPYCLQCTHTHTYLMVTGVSSHGGKVAGA